MLGRNITPRDVEGLLCGPEIGTLSDDSEARRTVINRAEQGRIVFESMVEDILWRKEKDERKRQAADR